MIEIVKAAALTPEMLRGAQQTEAADVTDVVAEVLTAVRERGDDAVREYTQRFDGAQLAALRVSEEELAAALHTMGDEYCAMLERAAANIRVFHQKQVRQGFVLAEQSGVVMGQRILPLRRVGMYVPGGTAAYPSSVLMTAIPAQIAGVKSIVMVTPPGADGSVTPAILAAASIAGVTDVFKVGGAQAVAALAYGTQSIPAVDKIVGPGNIFVATAKRMVYGRVDIDMIAGPSDILVVADESATPAFVAADMLGQAEHDKNAAAVLVTTSERVATQVQTELQTQLVGLSRYDIARASLLKNGRIILAETLAQAMEVANLVAPEHLELCVAEPFALLPLAQNAGSVFLGHNTPEALGDYFAGPNHTLPTEGTARFSSPLSVDDFVKKSSYLYYSGDALANAAQDVQDFAHSEGLQAHANSVAVRMQGTQNPQ